MVGTVDYVSPEQIRGDAVDGRADVYSLGCVLFECLTGEVPFSRASEVSVIYAHLEDEPPRPSERCVGVPVAFDAVLARALAKDPVERFQAAGDLAAAAQAALGADGVGGAAAAWSRPRVGRRVVVGGRRGPGRRGGRRGAAAARIGRRPAGGGDDRRE